MLQKSLHIANPNETERAGIIQFYEITFEMAWKVMQDFLESIGIDSQGPKGVLKNAFKEKLIENGQIWLEALQDRNLTLHTYDEIFAINIEQKIRNDYYPEIEKFYQWMLEKLD